MTHRIAAAALVSASLFLVGCGSSGQPRPEPVDVTMNVTLPGGQPASNVTVSVFPTSANQMQGGGKTDAAGKLKARLVPGPHTFAIEGNSPAMKSVPKSYQENNAEHKIDVPAGGGTIDVKLTT